MAFDFPNSPSNGQIFNAASGMAYQYTNGAWAEYRPVVAPNTYTKIEADLKFVDIAGDTMTGPLVINSTLTMQADPAAALQVATKQYVDNGLAPKAPLASPALTGTPIAPTAAPGTNTTQLATTAFVEARVVAGGGAAVAVISDTAPVTPLNGLFWWNSTDGNLYLSYNDGTSTQWVQVNAVGT